MSDSLFGWELRDGALESTCDSCAESKPLPYAWPETEAWLCAECWHDATEIDRARAEIVALRGALQALVDATAPVTAITYSLMSIHDTSWEDFDAARAVAVGLLTGGVSSIGDESP